MATDLYGQQTHVAEGGVSGLNDAAVRCIEAGNNKEAMEMLFRAMKINPRDRATVKNLVRLYRIVGMMREANDLAKAYAEQWPDDTELQPGAGCKGGGNYYGREYFDWQKNIGAFGGIANLFKFREFVVSVDTVVDFGCGGGYLLKNLDCARKIGVEINDYARAEAAAQGVNVVADVSDLADETADVVISNHALEHVESPLEALRLLRRKIKPGGRIVFVVPHQDCGESYNPGDQNKHLYTWNQQTLGNLFAGAGYMVSKVEAFQHQWPPDHVEIFTRFGEEEFHRRCREYAVKNNNYQVRVLGIRV